jgi:protein-export membrane protein SecD
MRALQIKGLICIGVIALSAYLLYPIEEKIKLGLDLKGGMHVVLQVDTKKLPEDADLRDVTDRVIEIIRTRVDEFGVREPLIQRKGLDKVVVQLPGIKDPDRAINLIGKTAMLEFKLVNEDENELKEALEGKIPEGWELLEFKRKGDPTSSKLLVRKEAAVTGADLEEARMEFGSDVFAEPFVSLKFTPEGAKKFAKVTEENIGKRLAIVLDNKIKSAPVIKSKIPDGRAQIEGAFTVQEATDLAIVLRAGALPAPVNIIQNVTVGPSLGEDSIRKGIVASIIGLLLVVVFMLIYYKFSGIIANIGLVVNLIALLAALSLFKATLTIPGIAGIILTIGMSIDSNVLIFERIKEERRSGKTAKASIEAGYRKAFLSIIDSRITTLISAVVLFYLGSGPIKGFAVTLSLGIIISFFSALVVTKLLFDLRPEYKKLSI